MYAHAVRTARWRYISYAGLSLDTRSPPTQHSLPPGELYDMHADPEERFNLLASHTLWDGGRGNRSHAAEEVRWHMETSLRSMFGLPPLEGPQAR